MPLVYEQDLKVCQFECDPWDRMTAGAALRRIQEIATFQCQEQGIDEQLYQRTHTLFLLSRISLEVQRMPRLYEQVRIQTRAYGMYRAVYHRVTSIHSAEGEKLCEADSHWILIDTQNRRILRQAPEEIARLYGPVTAEDLAEIHDMKFTKPTELTPFPEQTAHYSICDRNGHINNSRYADLMCDHLPVEMLKKAPPRKILLFYHNEILLSSPFNMSVGAEGESGHYFLAECDGKTSFEGVIRF